MEPGTPASEYRKAVMDQNTAVAYLQSARARVDEAQVQLESVTNLLEQANAMYAKAQDVTAAALDALEKDALGDVVPITPD